MTWDHLNSSKYYILCYIRCNMREAEPVLYWRVKVNGEWKYERANWHPYEIKQIGPHEHVYLCDLWPPELFEVDESE